MRLLSYSTENSFELTTFDDESLPPYAILSHTWADNQEVTYDEVVAGTGKQKAGYVKLRFCRERAAKDGLKYFWVDTCCINKATNDELGAAINSMFRWYQCATKCYVFLSDVAVPYNVVDPQLYQITWENAFRKSRWFTRGWTLQELLAPASVEFFSKEGRPLGSKISLEQEVHEITQIPLEVLRGQLLSKISVDERMSWAARRKTTIKEDKAYCLLGIFGVFMPLIYGEGEDHAFLRLKEEVRKLAARDNTQTSSEHRTGPEEIKKVTGLKRRTIFIIVVVALVVIAAVTGGAVGGTVGKSNKVSSNSSIGANGNPNHNSSTPALNSSRVLTNSKVAATNWTDAAGNSYHAVFWQAASSNLFVSLWISQLNNWTAINISASVSVSALPGTPLAAAARGYPWTDEPYNLGSFGIALFYLSPSNTVEEVYSVNGNVTTWEVGTLSTSGAVQTATTGSQLAVWWNLCSSGCDGELRVVYENANQALQMISRQDWIASPITWVNIIQHGSGLAATEGTVYGGESWNAHWLLKLYYAISGTLQESIEGSPLTDTLVLGAVVAQELPSTPSSLTSVEYADDNLSFGPIFIIVASIFLDGTVQASYFNNASWSGNVAPTLLGYQGSKNFTAGAMIAGFNVKFYGLTADGHINSFTVNRDTPLQWTFDPVSPF